MSYVKPVKQCVDAPLGFRTVNELVGNQDDTRALLEAEHTPQPDFVAAPQKGVIAGRGTRYASTAGLSEVFGGQHDTPKVARGELLAVLTEEAELFAAGAPTLTIALQSGVVGGLVRIATGKFFVPISGLENFDAEVFLVYDAEDTVARLIQQTPSQTGDEPGVYVTTWREATLLSSNLGFRLYDSAFHLIVYGFREEAPVTASPLTTHEPGASLGPDPFDPGNDGP